MKLLLTHVSVCDPTSPFHQKKCDVLLNNGLIENIQTVGKIKSPKTKTFDGNGLILAPGFVDMRTSIGEPGFEFKEDLKSAAQSASAGGFTTITCLPDTLPTIQHKADIEFIKRKAEDLPVHILPYGAITKNCEGKEMNELFDMHKAGAVGFTDANKTIMQAGVLERALEYSTIFGALILSHSEDSSIAGNGQMHEGQTSTELGLKGIPPIAEELIVNRDIELAKYTKSPLHLSHLSSKGSIELVRKAKKQGLKVTCDVAVANLIWTDELLHDFNQNYKLTPPLRGKADQKALWDGLADGTIDCIVTDHKAEDIEHKNVEFEYAAPGMIQLQTALSLLLMHAPKNCSIDTLITALTSNPRRILKLENVSIQTGNPAMLTLFSTKDSWTYTSSNNLSKSSNSPVLGQKLTGKVVATINKDKLYKHQ